MSSIEIELKQCRADLQTLRAENERLRKALDRIRLREAGPDGAQADFEMCKLIAQEAALAERGRS